MALKFFSLSIIENSILVSCNAWYSVPFPWMFLLFSFPPLVYKCPFLKYSLLQVVKSACLRVSFNSLCWWDFHSKQVTDHFWRTVNRSFLQWLFVSSPCFSFQPHFWISLLVLFSLCLRSSSRSDNLWLFSWSSNRDVFFTSRDLLSASISCLEASLDTSRPNCSRDSAVWEAVDSSGRVRWNNIKFS